MPGTFVVIPAFNEAATIRGVVESVLSRGVERVVVVDDGSADASADRVRDLDVALIRHSRNLGKGFALAAGIRHALEQGAERIVTFDGDGQHRAEDIPRLEQAARAYPGAVVIAARRHGRDNAPPMRRFGNDVSDFWVSWACGVQVFDSQSGFRLYPAAVLARLRTRPRRRRGFAFETALLIDAAAAGAAIRDIAVEAVYRPDARRSHYRPWRDTWSIILLVGSRLLARGMYPSGLWRYLRQRFRRRPAGAAPDVAAVPDRRSGHEDDTNSLRDEKRC